MLFCGVHVVYATYIFVTGVLMAGFSGWVSATVGG